MEREKNSQHNYITKSEWGRVSEQILICIRYFGDMVHLTFMSIKRISEMKNRDTKRYLLNISINRMRKTVIQRGERGKTEKKYFHN